MSKSPQNIDPKDINFWMNVFRVGKEVGRRIGLFFKKRKKNK